MAKPYFENKQYLQKRICKFLIENRKITYSQLTLEEFNKVFINVYKNNINTHFDINKINQIKKILINSFKDLEFKYQNNTILKNNDLLWGIKPLDTNVNHIKNKDTVYIIETGFLYNIFNNVVHFKDCDELFSVGCGFVIDDLTAYYDSTLPSRMELILNSDFEVPQSEIEKCRKIIKKIIDSKVTKYNNQPIYEPNFGKKDRKKVLVVDQSYGDYSIIKGGADDNTFKLMLETAIKENPESDILIKTHPDTIGDSSIRPHCYYQNIIERDNIYKITDFINPISMIEYVDKVYVCSSQFGFEALMCGKEVHTFGLPFYANWGLTIDNQKLKRRTRTRTLEEIFYIAYIMFSCYFNPKTRKQCEIEEVIDLLVENRNKYFEKQKEKENE